MSDHISGPRALADPIADITDVYAFPSPEGPDRLVLVMNTLPFAKLSNPLSDGLLYRFRVRPLTANAPGDPAPFAPGEPELVFDDRARRPPWRRPRDLRRTGAQRRRHRGVSTGPLCRVASGVVSVSWMQPLTSPSS
jgi:hypothetical protein